MGSNKKFTSGILTAVAVITCVELYKRVRENNPDGIQDCKDYPTEIGKAGVELVIDTANSVMDNSPQLREFGGTLLDDLLDFADGALTLTKIWFYDLVEALKK